MSGAAQGSVADNAAIDAAIESFWRHGLVGTTTRSLQRDLGLDAEAIEQAFGTKKAVRNRAVDAYLARVDRELVEQLDGPEAGSAELCKFYSGVLGWVTDPNHPGCMLVNLLAEGGPEDEFLATRAAMLRGRLTSAFETLLGRLDAETASQRASLLVVAFFGICMLARAGATTDEVGDFVASTQAQIRSWAD